MPQSANHTDRPAARRRAPRRTYKILGLALILLALAMALPAGALATDGEYTLHVDAPSSVTVGFSFSVTVTSWASTDPPFFDPTYHGLVKLTYVGPSGTVSLGEHQFVQAVDGGSYTFAGVTLNTVSSVGEVTAQDAIDPSISGTSPCR